MKIYYLFISILVFMSTPVFAEDEFPCDDDPHYVVNEFAAYATEYDASEQALIEEIADRVLREIEIIGTIEVIGHSSEYGNSDTQTASELRAEYVLDAITLAIEEKSNGEADHLYYEYYGAGIDCPVTNNNTQANRAKNRRAQVIIHARQPEDDDPEDDDDVVDDEEDDDYQDVVDDDEQDDNEEDVTDPDHRSWIELISVARETSNSAASKCIAKKLTNEGSDLAYLSARAINKVLNMKETKKVGRAVKKATVQMGNQLEAAYARILETAESATRTPEERLWRKLEQSRRSLVKGINLLDAQANCKDKRIVAMRKFIIDRMNKRRSIYNCKPIKQRAKAMLASIGGKAKGCSAN